MAGSNRKAKRKPKVSKGINGAKRHRLDEVQKVLLGKGLFEKFKYGEKWW